MTRTSTETTLRAAVSNQNDEAPYDLAFETVCDLTIMAGRGQDVNRLLIDVLNQNLASLVGIPEFQVALGVIPRPAPRRPIQTN